MASASFGASIEKLSGRDNYNTWQFAVQTYLQHEELWECVTGEETDAKKIMKAKSKIILMIEPVNYVHIQNATTAKEVWDKLKAAFEDSGLTRRVELLRTLVTCRLENCETVEEYVNQVVSTAHKLTGIGFEVSDEWIGTFSLAGLPDEYKPMIMGIESSGTRITGDAIKTKLLQDVKSTNSTTESAFYMDNKSKKSQVGLCAGFSTGKANPEDWFVDSGASMHMTMRGDWFKSTGDSQIKEIVVANDSKLQVTEKGNVEVQLSLNGDVKTIEIKEVLHVPNLSTNLLSVSRIVQKGYQVEFDARGCRILDGADLVATATLVDNMYKLDVHKSLGLMASVSGDNDLWHRRLGHINFNDLNKMKNGFVTGVDFNNNKDNRTCITCLKGKQSKLPFTDSETRATQILELVHSDLCGPMETESFAGAKYFLTLIDDFSRRLYVYFLKSKTQVAQTFANFKNLVENQTGKRIKTLRTDNGKEYCNNELLSLLQKAGIQHQTTNPYTPEQNGVAERKNRTIVERARCMIFDAGLETQFRAEAVSTAAYIINRSPTRGLQDLRKTPEEVWSGNKPNLKHLRIFGCKAMVHVPKQKRRKWDAKSEQLIFVGYCEGTKGYRFIRPNSNKLVKSRNVTFIENPTPTRTMTFTENQTTPLPLMLESSDQEDREEESEADEVGTEFDYESASASEDPRTEDSTTEDFATEDSTTDEPTAENLLSIETTRSDIRGDLKRPQRQRKPPKMDDYVLYLSQANEAIDPLTVEEALNGHEGQHWKRAMQEEYQSLIENDTWELTDLPPNRKPINSKWVFKTKTDDKGNVLRHKARLVIKGCAQKRGIDYEETFAPVVRYSSIRYLMALAAKHDLEIEQMDAVTAFLQGDLHEEVYMVPPKEFYTGDKVWRLKKAIYGLKQASRQWNIKLDTELKKAGLQQSKVDPCIYHKTLDEKMLFLAVYVDDLLIFTNDQVTKENLKNKLKKCFKMKEMGEAHHCVGLRITRDRQAGKIYLDQEKYIKETLAKFNMADCKPAVTPTDPNQKLTKDMSPKNNEEIEEMSRIPYQEAIGSILYVAQGTRPDLSYAINTVSKFNNNPGKAHWSAVKRILRYLKGTSKMRLEFSAKANTDLIGYCDADWASDTDERRSCTGYVFILQGAAISWNCKRQHTVALSTTEAEYMALSSATQEAMWLKQFKEELWPNDQTKAITIYCDNKSAINLAQTDGYHARSKHIDVRHHFVRQKLSQKYIKVDHVGTEKMTADILTKQLFSSKQNFCNCQMGLK
ncbi:uncharacterized protein [Neodiprion pinetum]|uniref:uncharacterized protein n=1 Tax=Neodiprion pinetum TaxID=441929 RepID=UPI001EDEE935|nr:uncharacterized protein LOC124214383 [Neodiprion pinetum]